MSLFRLIKMIRQFNALKGTKFVLADFCNNREIETLKKYLDSDGKPISNISLMVKGQPVPLEKEYRKGFYVAFFETDSDFFVCQILVHATRKRPTEMTTNS